MDITDYPFQIYQSNQVEQLYAQLKRELFQEGLSPFSKRIILVPSPAMKSWLMVRMADDPDIGIAAGMEFAYLDEGIQMLLRLFTGGAAMPGKLEMALALEWEMAKAVRDERHYLWEPLRKYLGCDAGRPMGGRSRRKLAGLAETLADLFLKYGKFGAKMTESWEAQPQAGWQEALWRMLARNWKPLSKSLEAPFLEDSPKDVSVHLFSISFLPGAYHRFLTRLSARVPLRHYMLSPCALFWSDIQGDKEARRLLRFWKQQGASEAQIEKLDHYLKDRNPLLANFGKLGREAALQVEASDALVHDHYRVDENAETLLAKLQQDILTLRNPDETGKEPIEEGDASLQVHAAPTPHREVQILYDLIIGLIEKHKGDADPVKPSDIVVMAPDIMKYEPYIRMVFSRPGSHLEAQIHDLRMPAQSPFAQAFLQLIGLVDTRWESDAVLNLIDLAAFREKQGWGHEEAALIRDWVKQAGIRWGVDKAHRREVLERVHIGKNDPEETGTWEFGLSMLLRGLVTDQEEEDGVDLPDAELLGQLLKLLRGLGKGLESLAKGERRASEWASLLQGLMRDYLDGENNDYQEAKAHIERILASIADFTKSAPEALYPFSSIRRHLESALSNVSTSYRESQLQAVRFCSLLPMRTIPAKVVALMGMDENAYPRSDTHFSLDLLKSSSEADYSPSQSDFDRYLFLEGLLSARRYFILTYTDTSQDDFKEQAPSLLVSELLDYVGQAFEGDPERLLRRHPFRSYDKSCFVEGTSFPVYSKERYRDALAFYSKSKKPLTGFIPSFSTPESDGGMPEVSSIDLKDLKSFCSNSLKTYFKKKLGIHLSSADGAESATGKLNLDNLELHHIKNEIVQHPLSHIVKKIEERGRMPSGVMRLVTVDKLQQLYDGIQAVSGDSNGKACAFQFTSHCRAPEQDEKGDWLLPPWSVKLTNGKIVKVTGTITGITPSGLIDHREINATGMMKSLPFILAYLHAIKEHNLPFPPLLIETKKSGSASFDAIDPEPFMQKLIETYLKGMEAPLPLLSEWADHWEDSDSDTFQEKAKSDLMNDFKSNFNNELNWLFRTGFLPQVQDAFHENQKWMASVVEPLLACKVKKKSGKAKEKK